MSHELRTPLNSLLTLARVLAENEDGNLTAKQLEYARSINGSGADLLKLINEVLDLSKVEAGKMEVAPREIAVAELRSFVERSFTALAHHRGLEFVIDIAADVPERILTDPERLQQVLKNLLDNAFKFTERGRVGLRFAMQPASERVFASGAERILTIAVSDSGIGIPREKQQIIFEAFQQADGTTSRRYGGTGLGLSISREIIRLLGGEIAVESIPGEGSTFTVSLPTSYPTSPRLTGFPRQGEVEPSIQASRHSEGSSDDSRLLNRAAQPPHLAENHYRRLLIVAHEANMPDSITELLGVGNVWVRTVTNAQEAIREADSGFDCITIDARDETDLDLAEAIKNSSASRHIPVVLYAGEELLAERRSRLTQHADSVIPRNEPYSMGLLIKDLIGLVQIAPERLPERALQAVARARLVGYPVEGKKALVIDDDIRNIFAVTTLLERSRMRVVYAESGRAGIAMLRENPDVCVVLMDIMMPEMDGYETIRVIRAEPRWKDLPVIAVTARSLKEDRDQCLRSGASDHLAKPIDENKLIQLIALWTRSHQQAA
jgi:two-component system chemotaxis sensor kinase CheA